MKRCTDWRFEWQFHGEVSGLDYTTDASVEEITAGELHLLRYDESGYFMT